MTYLYRKLKSFFSTHSPPPVAEPLPVLALTEEEIDSYSFIIGSQIGYFNELNHESRMRFIQRVHEFRRKRKFHYIGLEEREEIGILVSASAVQVTFGLKNYMLSHFENIYVLADAYRMDSDEEFYIGHVAPDGIYLSWKHFVYGYTQKKENVNVAIHEMAHALLYNNFFARYGIDMQFRLNYEKFSTTTGPILADVITTRKSYLRSYAFSNLHEFWAVSVEAFFCNPKELHWNMPDLYDAISRVLNQDPTADDKILKSTEL
jgi:MtfA peptidase